VSTLYDLVVIGGGSAGLVAVDFAAEMGARTALVEKHRIGGDCTWTGCVPSKTLLKSAKVAHQMRAAARYGLTPVKPQVDLKSVMDRVREAISEVYQHETPEVLREKGIDVVFGKPRFRDAHTLLVEGKAITAHNFLIATGAHPFVPPIEGLDQVAYLTYESVWKMEQLPQHLIVVGAGPIGCEMSQAFHRLGAEVTLLASRDRVLPRDDPMAAQVLGEVFAREGIRLHLNSRAQRVWQDEAGIHVTAGDQEVVGDALLVVTGRRPNVAGLDLEKAGVDYTESGIQVDDRLRTMRKNIFAAGDVIGSHQFTHYAGWQGFQAVRNALLPGSSRGVSSNVPWTTFTDPEVAHVGLSEEQAREEYTEGYVSRWPMSRVDRAVAEGDTAGFIKLVYTKDRTVVGATIVAERAGEMIHEWIMAVEQGMKVGELAGFIHVYPTYSMASMRTAAAIRLERVMGSFVGRVIRGFAGSGQGPTGSGEGP
jgi:pyruvate/2-oxoglutarate dehydrogenase complex dihydrolipoamide dehydrogenase (E3) component